MHSLFSLQKDILTITDFISTVNQGNVKQNCTNQQPPQRGACGPRPRLGRIEMAAGLPEGLSYPGHSLHFFTMLPLNDCRRAAHSFFKIGRLFAFFPFSCPFLARLRLLILLLLLMSGNVHPNPGPIFPCSVCAGNVT